MNISRRQALRTVTAAAGFAIGGKLVHLLLSTRLSRYPLVKRQGEALAGLLRPPGALAEPQFLAACIRCTRCQDACEPGAIQFYTAQHGDRAHTPYVDPARKGCTLCLKCGPECPTGALVVLQEPSAAAMGSVVLNEDLCLSYKALQLRDEQDLLVRSGRQSTESQGLAERRGPCGECYTFCPLRGRAINLKPGGFLAPLIHTEHCVGCGMCEEICRHVVRGEPAIRVLRTRRPVGVKGSQFS